MANWSDPRTTAVPRAATGARDAAFDAGLRSYMLSVYNYMASGVLLTGIVAMLFVNTTFGLSLLANPAARLIAILDSGATGPAAMRALTRAKSETGTAAAGGGGSAPPAAAP